MGVKQSLVPTYIRFNMNFSFSHWFNSYEIYLGVSEPPVRACASRNSMFSPVLRSVHRRSYQWLSKWASSLASSPEDDWVSLSTTASKRRIITESRKFSLKGDGHAALRWLNGAENPNTAHFQAVLATIARSSVPELAITVLKKMEEHNIPPSRKIYLEVLLAYSKSGNGREAELVIDRMRQRNMDVSGKALQLATRAVLNYAGTTERELRQALRMLMSSCLSKDNVPDVLAVNDVIFQAARLGNMNIAIFLLDWMEEKGVASDEYTYGALVMACSQRSHRAALLMLQECRKRGKVSLAAYGWALSAATRALDETAVSEVLDCMEKDGIEPTVRDMTRVIICHGRLGNAELAVKAFRYLEQKGGQLTPSLISCYATIEACTAAENEDLADTIFRESLLKDIISLKMFPQDGLFHVDFHGHSCATAIAALRTSIADLVMEANRHDLLVSSGMSLITGHGEQRSKEPRMRPALQEYLKEKWNVPCYFTASNPGILRITPASILLWQEQLLQAALPSKEGVIGSDDHDMSSLKCEDIKVQ